MIVALLLSQEGAAQGRSLPNPGLVFNIDSDTPNPSYTTISFSLKNDDFVIMRLFDPLGNLLKELVNSPLNAGNHQVSIDTRSIQPGIYFYNLRIGDSIETRKLTIKK